MFKRIIRVSILSICIGGLLGACSPGQKTDITPDNAGKVQLLNTFRLPESPVGEFNRCSLAFSPDGSLLAGSCSNRVPVWDVGSGKVKYTLYEGFQSQIVDCQFNTDGRTIACGGYDLVITMFNAANGKPIGSLGSTDSPIWELAYSPDGQQIASGSLDTDLRLWDITSGSMVWGSTGIRGVLSVSFSPDGKKVAFGTRQGKRAGLLDSVTGETLMTFLDPPANVGDIVFSPDGTLIAAGCDDNKVYLWNAADRELIGTLAGHAGYVNGVSINPDGTLLASGSHDKTVGIWDVTGQRQLTSLPGHTEAVLRVEFSPDGKLLASISWDGTIKLWGINSGD